MSFIVSFIFGRVQFPIAHEKGDSLPYEIFIKGPSGSGKTSLICPLEIFFEAPGMKEWVFPKGNSWKDFALSSFGPMKQDDALFVYFRDVQEDFKLDKADLVLMIEGGPPEKKPCMIFRKIHTNDDEVDQHPWWWRFITVGTTFTSGQKAEDGKTTDNQVLRLLLINTFKVVLERKQEDMKKYFGEETSIPLMVISAALYRRWCRKAKELSAINPDNVAEQLIPAVFREDKKPEPSPLEAWITDSDRYHKTDGSA